MKTASSLQKKHFFPPSNFDLAQNCFIFFFFFQTLSQSEKEKINENYHHHRSPSGERKEKKTDKSTLTDHNNRLQQ